MADFKSITSHYGSVSGSVAAGQNSELCHKLTALQNGFLQIEILIVIVRDVNRSPNVRTSDPVPKFVSKF